MFVNIRSIFAFSLMNCLCICGPIQYNIVGLESWIPHKGIKIARWIYWVPAPPGVGRHFASSPNPVQHSTYIVVCRLSISNLQTSPTRQPNVTRLKYLTSIDPGQTSLIVSGLKTEDSVGERDGVHLFWFDQLAEIVVLCQAFGSHDRRSAGMSLSMPSWGVHRIGEMELI